MSVLTCQREKINIKYYFKFSCKLNLYNRVYASVRHRLIKKFMLKK